MPPGPTLPLVSPALRTLSLAAATDDPAGFAADLGRSFERFGFAIVADHGIEPALIERGWAATRALFALSDAEKRRCHDPAGGGARGYTPFGVEVAKDASVTDLKEFWHIGRELAPDHRFAEVMAPNIWPELPGVDAVRRSEFQGVFRALFTAFDDAGTRLLAAIARHLRLRPDWFNAAAADGNSILRLLHYPPVAADARGVRAGAHEDINLITLLLGAEEAGLELLGPDGGWLSIEPPAGALVVNVGDMLQRLTNHVLPSTTHRVVNPPPDRRGVSRYSMPFFLHPAPDFLIETLPGCVDAGHPDRYPVPITAHDYLQQRLIEIGLVR